MLLSMLSILVLGVAQATEGEGERQVENKTATLTPATLTPATLAPATLTPATLTPATLTPATKVTALPTIVPLDCTKGSACENAGGDCLFGKAALDEKMSLIPKCHYLKESMCNRKECQCCINCGKNAAKSDCHIKGGVCTKECECKTTEYPSLYECPSAGCSCCQPCETSRACYPGQCYGNITTLTGPEYVIRKDIPCPHKECTCVQKCYDRQCSLVGGQCVHSKEACYRMGGTTVFDKCACGPHCFCCVRGRPFPFFEVATAKRAMREPSMDEPEN